MHYLQGEKAVHNLQFLKEVLSSTSLYDDRDSQYNSASVANIETLLGLATQNELLPDEKVTEI